MLPFEEEEEKVEQEEPLDTTIYSMDDHVDGSKISTKNRRMLIGMIKSNVGWTIHLEIHYYVTKEL